VNKPRRPLPSGRLTISQVWWFTNIAYALALVLAWFVTPHKPALSTRHECFWLVLVAVVCTYIYSVPPMRTKRLGIWANVTIAAYAIALVLAWLVEPHRPALTWSAGRHECFWLVAIAVVCTYIYSVPPLRTKRLGIWANITIAIPRGTLLKVAGWSSAKTIVGVEPWYIGAIFGLFLLGATTTKDFADMEGDRRGGCRTLPIQFGVSRAAWMISPSFVIPFLMIPVGAWLGILTGSFWLLQLLGIVMTLYGLYVCYLMLRRPEELAVEENHVSWAHMYRMMFVAQIGFALAYLL